MSEILSKNTRASSVTIKGTSFGSFTRAPCYERSRSLKTRFAQSFSPVLFVRTEKMRKEEGISFKNSGVSSSPTVVPYRQYII